MVAKEAIPRALYCATWRAADASPGRLPDFYLSWSCTLLLGRSTWEATQMPAAASTHWAIPLRQPTVSMSECTVAPAACFANLLAWAGPWMRPTSRVSTLLMPVPMARWAWPTRPANVVVCPCCGREGEVRRLAGPGLGCAVITCPATRAVGRLSLRSAALPSTAVGGGREQPEMRGTPRGTQDNRLRLQPLLLTLASPAADRRREEKSPSLRSSSIPISLSSIGSVEVTEQEP